MNAVLNRVISLREFYRQHEKWIIADVSFVLLILFGMRSNWSFDYVSAPILVVFVCTWFLVLINLDKRPVGVPLGLMRWLGFVALVSFASHFLVVSSGNLRIAVHMDRGETTLSTPFILHIPFSRDISFVDAAFSPKVEKIAVQASDGVALRCSVNVYGVVLDGRDPAKLEQSLVMNNLGGDPGKMINTRLEEAIKLATSTALNGMSSAQIASSDNRFRIPYEIGTPLGDALAKNVLRWQDGSVNLFCDVSFNS